MSLFVSLTLDMDDETLFAKVEREMWKHSLWSIISTTNCFMCWPIAT